MGVVLKSFDSALNRFVAIKVLAPQWSTSVSARRRFAREARATAAVSHEHVVAIYGVDEVRGLPYLVMEYVHGHSLQQRLDRTGALGVAEILRIGMQVASGLAAAHAQGLIHRDIKPANILLEHGIERVKITDFGLARAIDDASLTQTGAITGTPQYMAPEQARGGALDHRADLFSLGSVLYALCTGRPPFRAANSLAVLNRVCECTPRPIREINPDIPDWLAEIVEWLHAKDPEERCPSAVRLSRLLARHLADLQRPSGRRRSLPAPVGPEPAPQRGPGRLLALLGLLALLLVLLPCVGLGLALRNLLPRGGQGPVAPALPAPWIAAPPRARLFDGEVIRQPGEGPRIRVSYELKPGAADLTRRYVWVVRAGKRTVYERTLQQQEVSDKGTLAVDLSDRVGKGEGALETFLACERLVPGILDFQRERISETLKLE